MAKKNQNLINVPLPQAIVDAIDSMAQYLGPDTDRTAVAANLIIRGAKSIEAEMKAGKKVKVPKKIWLPDGKVRNRRN